MGDFGGGFRLAVIWVLAGLGAANTACPQEVWRLVIPEQRRLEVRDPSQLPRARLPDLPPPRTVSNPQPDTPALNLSLDDAVRTALANTQVVRVLAGVSAVSSGRTIYGPAITNTQIDQARGRFDPSLQVNNNFHRQHAPQGDFDPGDPTRARIVGDPTHDYEMSMGLRKDLVTGATAGLSVNANPTYTRTDRLPLNPQTPSSVDLSLTQPLLRGAGPQVNLAPVVIAGIETERSFFQTKDSVQEMVRGTIEAYWALVAARTGRWARQQQVAQGQEALQLAKAELKTGRKDIGDVYQSQSSLNNFLANLVIAEANVLQREAALRNILGLPPSDSSQIVPVTAASKEWLSTDWPEIVGLAEERRPDLIELKLILEADQQRLLVSRNQALPQVNARALYRWNGLEGRMPNGESIASEPGRFTGWELGINFSVPLGLREARASMREQELILMQDRANLEQGLHAASHALADSLRSLAQYHKEYQAFAEARDAAQKNLLYQFAKWKTGQAILLNYLQAITDWGNAVSAEAQALTRYNTELANLERQTGTILETHGIRFVEERFCSIGPLGRLFEDRPYPRDSRPGVNEDRYPSGSEPAENAFDLQKPALKPRSPAKPAPPAQPQPTPEAARPAPRLEEIPRGIPEPLR